MSVIENAVQWAINIANDSTHGYDQSNRWGADYDCSSLVVSAWEQAGVKVKTAGATYTGNMYAIFLKNGFTDVTSSVNLSTGNGVVRGDVLLNKASHTAMSIGDGKIVHASINENGKVTGGTAGDQTGKEICTRNYYNHPWDCVLRYKEANADGLEECDNSGSNTVDSNISVNAETAKCKVEIPVLSKGSSGDCVKILQGILTMHNFDIGSYGCDGDFGSATETAVKNFQTDNSLTADGIVGSVTWSELLHCNCCTDFLTDAIESTETNDIADGIITAIEKSERIWAYLKANSAWTDNGIAAVMGNMRAESNFIPNNMQDSYEKSSGYTDETYTKAVQDGTYRYKDYTSCCYSFSHDGIGYGLVQWTYWSRKKWLYEKTVEAKQEIGNLEWQCQCVIDDFSTNFQSIDKQLKDSSKSLSALTALVLKKYESPADSGSSVQAKRLSYATEILEKYSCN